MKKKLILVLIFTLCLSACNNSNINESSKYISNNNVSVSSLTATSSTHDNSSAQNTNNTTSTLYKTCEHVEYHMGCDTIEEFIEWTKKGGEDVEYNYGNSKYNPCSANFLNWRKTQTEFSVPILKNNDYKLIVVKVNEKNFHISYAKTKPDSSSNDRFFMRGYTLNKKQQKMTLDELEKNLENAAEFFEFITATPQKGVCRWGEYHTAVTPTSNLEWLWFVHSSILYVINPGKLPDGTSQWQEEYFDYFDFETVSLK